MGADIKTLRTRIKSIDSTRQITSAMGLVASSKLRRAAANMSSSADYLEANERIIKALAQSPECLSSVYMKNTDGKTCVIAIAGDRGLAGGYNASVFRLADAQENARIIPIGRKICERMNVDSVSSEAFSVADAYTLADAACRDFSSGRYSQIKIIYTEYISALRQETAIKTIFPIEKSDEHESAAEFEPDAVTVLNGAVREYAAAVILSAVRESFVSELTQRRAAMDNAQRNADEMLNELHIKYNRARQGAVTQEITEITAGSGE